MLAVSKYSVFLGVPCLCEDIQPWMQLSVFAYQEQADSDYNFALKWWNGSKIPFISYHLFSPSEYSTAIHWFLLTWVFASLIQWQECCNQSSFVVGFFFLEDSEVAWMRGRRRWKYVNVVLSPKEALTSHLETVLSGAGTKRHSLFTVHALFSCFISLSVAIRFAPYFPLLKRRKKRIAKKQKFQARVCMVLADVC